jgi:hypothetical protein
MDVKHQEMLDVDSNLMTMDGIIYVPEEGFYIKTLWM